MLLTRFSPCEELQPFSCVGREFEDVLSDVLDSGRSVLRADWVPQIDIFEDKETYIVQAELPGMKRENIDISLSDTILTIKGDRPFLREKKEEEYHLVERSYGEFVRAVRLPGEVKGDSIKAIYQDGILEVTLPQARAKVKHITVDLN